MNGNFILDLDGFESILPNHLDIGNPVIDLRGCSFVKPEGALGIFLLLRYWKKKGRVPSVLRPINPDIDSYFERTGVIFMTQEFVNYTPPVDNVINNVWNERDSINEIIPVTNQEEAAKVVEKFGRSLKEQFVDWTAITRLQSAMIETFQNMPDHANPKNLKDFEGYANLQTYKNGSRVVVAAGDLGIGIRKSLQTCEIYRRLDWTDMDAIKKVINEAASRFDEEGIKERGGGLQRAIKNVSSINGVTIVRSGNCAVRIDPYGRCKEMPLLKFFPGTQVCITVFR